MNAPWIRYWQGLSPALRRYYRASLWPSLLFIGLTLLHEWAARRSGLALPLRIGFALAPALCLAWMFGFYLRFLRDCDELERRIELDALAWAAGIGILATMAALFVLDAGLAAWPASQVTAVIGLLLICSYALVRVLLHRRVA